MRRSSPRPSKPKLPALHAARIRLWLSLPPVLAAVHGGAEQAAQAQAQYAQIQGVVTAEETGKPLGSVTVVVNGPALQDFQSEVTDAAGRYVITQLPPGDDYQVSFYFGSDDKPRVIRPGIRLSLGKTITVNAKVRLESNTREVKVIKESAPNVDTASASTGVEVNQEVLRNTPVRGRTFESVMTLAPGAADVAPRRVEGGDVGVSVSGSTGNENNFIIDGLNTTDPNLGVLGTELSQYFIKDFNVITGGYQAEYGRATGGVVTIATKSGGNEFHGSVFGSLQPYQLPAKTVARLGEALATRTKTFLLYDFGFDLGGYILKDRIWFYMGFAPTFTHTSIDRAVRTQSQDPVTGRARTDEGFGCPSYLADNLLCDGPRQLALATSEVDGLTRNLMVNKRLYNWIAKLQFNLTPDHNITLGYIGSPTTYDDYDQTKNWDVDSSKFSRVDQIHDVTARYIGKLFNRKLQIDILYGYHYQTKDERPERADLQRIEWRRPADNPFSLSDFEDVSPCRITASGFNPCPLTAYGQGYPLYENTKLQRHQLLAALTAFASFTGASNPLRGIHAIKLGFDFEDLLNDNVRTYGGTDIDPSNPASGHRSFRTDGSGEGLQIRREYATKNQDGTYRLLNDFAGNTETRNFSVYLRDSWNVGWAPGLVLNLGVRWEGQEIYAMDGTKAISLYDNWAPRIGLAYDFTQLTNRPGRGKIFFNYGRFYQSIPLDINDRQFTGEGLYSSTISSSCDRRPYWSGAGAGREVPFPSANCNFQPTNPPVNGGEYGHVAPNLKGQYINEIVLGLNYDVGLDIVVGISYIHRDLGNIIEDLSTDGGSFYLLANPGKQADPAEVARLERELAMLQPGSYEYEQKKGTLDAYRSVGTIFPTARRNYDALVLTLNKRLSNRFSVLASYTYSRTVGNYPGTFSSSNNQLDPNISTQFDITDLLANRNGPLPTDRPHNFKATGFYDQPLGEKRKLTIGLTFTAFSGRPIEVLGAHPTYGPREVYILPRGSGGRTPAITQFDLHIGYEQKLSRLVSLSVFGDIVNLFNQREIINVDDEYTTDFVGPIVNGRVADLRHLKTTDGLVPVANSNYGQPTAFQEPMYFRVGARLSF